jgi:predicted dehydrogenase
VSTAAAFTIVPSHVFGGPARKAPSDKLNIAGIGFGGMGANYIRECESENITALCDVDDVLPAKTFEHYPNAKRYRDYRKLLDREKEIDAVIIGTPDHSHAIIASAAILAGKHVYCAKPMTRTIHEARQITKAARAAGVATQMSVQSCASDPARSTEEWIQAGLIGAVREVHVWSDRPVWPQGMLRPPAAEPPSTLDWNLWLGPAPERPYSPLYHPFNWRGWYDFGTGALGDMGCHTFHVIVTALNLSYPAAVQASTNFMAVPAESKEEADPSWSRSKKAKFPETFPMASIVTWDFPARDSAPPVRLTWYDGGLTPPRPVNWDPQRPFPASGILFYGDKGVLFSGFSGGPRLVPEPRGFVAPERKLPRSVGHYKEWIQAAKGGPPANCNFDFASLLAEIALLGVVAQRTGRSLTWDSRNARFTNDAQANEFVSSVYRSGWSL